LLVKAREAVRLHYQTCGHTTVLHVIHAAHTYILDDSSVANYFLTRGQVFQPIYPPNINIYT
jgi:hypothetical protein